MQREKWEEVKGGNQAVAIRIWIVRDGIAKRRSIVLRMQQTNLRGAQDEQGENG